MTDFSVARTNMVDCQIQTAGVAHADILAAFSNVPRELFVPKASQKIAYMDEDLVIGDGRFLMEPITHARMLQAASPQKDDVVLDISNTNGYSAAILSTLVTTIVCIEEKKKGLDQNLSILADIDVCNVAGFKGDLVKGCPEHAPYDLIFMGGSVTELPTELIKQLGPNGRLITIVKPDGEMMGQVTLVQSLGEKGFSSYTLFEAACPYLPGFEPRDSFTF